MSGKRTHGSGSVEQLPSGRWRFKLTSADGKRRASPSYDTRAECEQVLAAALEELAAGNMAPIGAVTLGAYAERFLARLTICTAKDDRARWKLHVEPTELARLPIAEVKRRHVRDFMAALATKKKLVAAAGGCPGEKVEGSETLSVQSQKLVLGLLRRIFNEAKIDELTDSNPCEGVKVARAGSASEDTWSFLSLEEIERLCAHPGIPEVKRLIYQTAIYTGLREGELWALRWGDLDLDGEHPTCTCRRSYKKSTKNGKTRRFPLLPAAVDTLRRVREQAASTDTDDLVFPNRDGGMYCKGYDAEWGRWSRRAGIREEVRFHDLRHTCASHLAMGSWGRAWTLAEIRDYVGHSSVSMTERYSHLGPGHLKTIASETKIVHGSSTLPRVVPAISVAGRQESGEPAHGLGNSCSIQLSYAVVRRAQPNRTDSAGQLMRSWVGAAL